MTFGAIDTTRLGAFARKSFLPNASTKVRGVMFAINGMPVKMPCCRRFMFDISSSGAAGTTHIASSKPAPSRDPTHPVVRKKCWSPNKKIPKASTDPEDCTRNSSSPIPQPTRERRSTFLGGLLAHGSPYSPRLPIRRGGQWRLRVSSPFTAAGPRGTCTLFPYPGVTMWRAL